MAEKVIGVLGGMGPEATIELLAQIVRRTRAKHDREHLRVLFGRFYTMPDEFMTRVFNRHLQPILVRFQAALERALPDVPVADRMSSMMFTAGAMVHIMAWSRLLSVISRGALDPSDTKALTNRIVAFTAGGFRAVAERAHCLSQGTLHA